MPHLVQVDWMKSNVVFGLFSLSSFSSAELCRISIILWLLLSTTELEINFCSVLYITKYYTEKQKAEIRWDFSNSSRWFVFQISISVQVDIFDFGRSEFDFSVGVLSELSPNLLDPSSWNVVQTFMFTDAFVMSFFVCCILAAFVGLLVYLSFRFVCV